MWLLIPSSTVPQIETEVAISCVRHKISSYLGFVVAWSPPQIPQFNFSCSAAVASLRLRPCSEKYAVWKQARGFGNAISRRKQLKEKEAKRQNI